MEDIIPCPSETKEQTHCKFSQCTPCQHLCLPRHLEEQRGCLSFPAEVQTTKRTLVGSPLLCSSSASYQHQPHPHPAAGDRAFEPVLAVLGSLTRLAKGCCGIQTGSALLKNQRLNPELGAGHYGSIYINPDFAVQSETSSSD